MKIILWKSKLVVIILLFSFLGCKISKQNDDITFFKTHPEYQGDPIELLTHYYLYHSSIYQTLRATGYSIDETRKIVNILEGEKIDKFIKLHTGHCN